MTDPNLTQLQAILFDFDGTLAPNLNLPDMRRQVITLTETFAVPEATYQDKYIVEVIAAATTWLTEQSSDIAEGYNKQAHQLITDIELSASTHTEPFPGMREKLLRWRDQGLALGVVTRNCRAAVLQVFPDLLNHVDVLHARGDTPYLKPDPRHLAATLHELDSSAERAAMVGDGALDMHAGRALDMYCVGVLSGSADTQALQQAGAHIVLDNCLSLPI